MTRITRGTTALLALLALLAGIPATLITLAGNPIPAHPSLSAAWSALSTTDYSGHVLTTLLVWVAWIAWVAFAVSVLLEIPAQLAGARAPRLPGFSAPQLGARILVGAVLAMLSIGAVTGPAHAATGAPPQTAAPASQSTLAQPHTQANPVTDDKSSAPTAEKVTVRPGDTLWGLSQRTTGTGTHWREIYNATKGTVQPDGRHITNPNVIDVGETVTIPASLAHHDSQPVRHQPAAKKPAETTHKPPAQAAPTSPQAQPSPVRQAPGEGATHSPHAGALPNPGTAARISTSSDSIDIVNPWTITGLSVTAAAGALLLLSRRRDAQNRRRKPGRRIAMPDTDAATTETTLRSDAAHDPLAIEDLDLALRTLAAVCTAHQQPVPELRAARITQGALELYLTDEDVTLPDPFTTIGPGVWTIDRNGIPRLLDPNNAADIPAPFPTLMTLGQDEEDAWVLLNLEHAGALTLAGGTDAQAEVLRAMTLELIGSGWADDLRVTLVDVMPDLADALGSDRATHVDDLDHVLTSLEYAADVHAKALRDAGADNVTQARADGIVPDAWMPQLLILAADPTTAQADRIRTLLDRVPRLAVAALTSGTAAYTDWVFTLHPDQTATLDPYGMQLRPQRLDENTYTRMLQVFRTTEENDQPGPVWAADIDDEPALHELPAPTAPEPGEDVDETAAADEPAVVDKPEPEITTTPAEIVETTTEPAAKATTATDVLELADRPPFLTPIPTRDGPLVRLLGPVEIQNAPGKQPSSPGRATELIAYLALHPGRDHEPLDNALWPGKPMTATKRNGPVSQARGWLGNATDGHPHVALVDEQGYRLAPDTPVDWIELQDLIGGNIQATSTDNLKHALQLVAGPPLTAAVTSKGRSPRVLWSWSEVDRQEMIATIADIAHALATRALRAGDARLAAWAAAKGTMVEPASEVLWRDSLRAAYLSAIPGRVEHVAADLTEHLEAITGELEPETLDLLNEILGHDRTRHAS